MQDPKPSNITGKKVQKHSFDHIVRWDVMAAAIVIGYIAWKVLGSGSDSDDQKTTEMEEAVDVEVSGIKTGV